MADKKVGAIRETFVNASENYMFGEDVTEDPFTDDPGEIFRFAQEEYGGCVSRMYRDTADGPKACGWVFQRYDRYEDTGGRYLREVWVELLEAPDTVTRTAHPLYL